MLVRISMLQGVKGRENRRPHCWGSYFDQCPYRRTDVKNAFVRLRRRVLNEQEQELLILRVSQGLSFLQIANILDLPQNDRPLPREACRKRFERTKRKLEAAVRSDPELMRYLKKIND